jgi:hypothetical protein
LLLLCVWGGFISFLAGLLIARDLLRSQQKAPPPLVGLFPLLMPCVCVYYKN